MDAALVVVREQLQALFTRYGNATNAGATSISGTGLRYLLSTAGLDIDVQTVTNKETLSFDEFLACLRELGRSQQGGLGGGDDSGFVRFASSTLVPEALQHPAVIAAMQPLRRGPSPPPPPRPAASSAPLGNLQTSSASAVTQGPARPLSSPADPLGRASALLEKLSHRQLPSSQQESPTSSTRSASPVQAAAPAHGFSFALAPAAPPLPLPLPPQSLSPAPAPAPAPAPINEQVRSAFVERLTASSSDPERAAAGGGDGNGNGNGDGDEELSFFLSTIQLPHLLPTLKELGCATVSDLADCSDEELSAAGVKALHCRRIRAAFARYQAGETPLLGGASSNASSVASVTFAGETTVTTTTYNSGSGALTTLSRARSRNSLSPSSSSSSSSNAAAARPASTSPSRRSFELNGGGSLSSRSLNAPVPTVSAPASARSPVSAPASASAPAANWDWEEYANEQGYLYYHCPRTGVTTWTKPAPEEGSVRTVQQRALEAQQQQQQQRGRKAGGAVPATAKDTAAVMAQRVAEAVQSTTASEALVAEALQQTLEAAIESSVPRVTTDGARTRAEKVIVKEELERFRVQERAENGLSMWPHSKFGVPSAAAPERMAVALTGRLGKAPLVASSATAADGNAHHLQPSSSSKPAPRHASKEGSDGSDPRNKVLAQSDAGAAIFHHFHRKEDHLLGKSSSRGRWVRGVDVTKIPELHPPNPTPQINGPTTAFGVTISGTAAPESTEISAGFLQPSSIAPTPGQYAYLPPTASSSSSSSSTTAPSAADDTSELSGALSMSALLTPAVGNEKEKAAFSASYLSTAKRAKSASARVKEGAVLAREFRAGLKNAVDAHYNSTSNSVVSSSSASSVSGLSMAEDNGLAVSSYAAIHGQGQGQGQGQGISAAELYPSIYQSLPTMDPRTFDAISRHGLVVNSRRMGYADPRPDVRPSRSLMPAAACVYPDSETHHVFHEAKKAIDFTTPSTGLQGKSESIWAAQLRPHLHSSVDDPKAPRAGREMKQLWASGGLAPSEAATGYAYRHAAAHSMLTGSGSVYDRLTDVRGYTGTHRHRFDETGRGLGLAGRDNSYDYRMLTSVPTDEQAALPTAHLADLKQHSQGSGKVSSTRGDAVGFL